MSLDDVWAVRTTSFFMSFRVVAANLENLVLCNNLNDNDENNLKISHYAIICDTDFSCFANCRKDRKSREYPIEFTKTAVIQKF